MTINKPQIIKDVGFDFSWDEKNVWKLQIETVKMDITNLIWHFDIPFLWVDGGVYNATPKEVMENPEKYQSEYERTMDADMKYPIDIMENKGRWLILDGLHRLMKASVMGITEVDVRIIPRDEIQNITTN